MKRILSYITAGAFAATLFSTAFLAGCAEDAGEVGRGEGILVLDASFGERVTRAVAPETYTVKIGNSKGYTHLFDNTDAPSELWLVSGEYFVEVEGGDAFSEPSWDKPEVYYYKEQRSFVIESGKRTPVKVECAPRNTSLSIGFDETVTDLLTDYSVKVYPDPSDRAKSFVFDAASAGQTLYLMLAEDQTEIEWEFRARQEDYPSVLKTGKFQNLTGGKAYSTAFTYTFVEKTGTFTLTATLDERTLDVSHDIVISQKPRIVGVSSGVVQNPSDRQMVGISPSAGNIESIVLSGSMFGAGYELISASDLSSYGIALTPNGTGYEMELSWAFFTAMALADPTSDTSSISITATDTRERVNTVELKVATAPSALSLNTWDAWATRITVGGVALRGGNIGFACRLASGGSWNSVEATGQNGKYSTTITGLTPNTGYEVTLTLDGTPVGETRNFTTESAPQLPNAGFEQWHWSGNTLYPDASGEHYWDSGNEGSSNAPVIGGSDKNNNTQENDPRPGSTGTSSIKLNSEWYGMFGQGAFAAGSVYTGDFVLARADASNPSGVVSFGRPFVGRPTAMTVWFKGKTGTVDYAKGGAPLSNGQQDKYQIYIALADSGFPCEVDTSNWDNLIKYATDPRILAYGEMVGSQTVGSWTKITIPIEYRSLSRIPTHIVLVASASMYGDYFTGSTGSEIQIDDIELIYE